jgi:hypothetical protein
MNNRTSIDNELKVIAPGLIQVPVAMPYAVPPDYFLHLTPHLLHTLNAEPTLPNGLSTQMPYEVPTGYFKGLAAGILERIKNDADSLAVEENLLLTGFPRQLPYQVPDGYFTNLPATILQKVAVKTQQTIPDHYFESFPEQMLAKVRQLETRKELDEVAPLLNTISRKPVQHLPQRYFENLQPANQQRSTNTTSAPVVPIKKQVEWLRYAAAACLLFLLSFGAYFLYNGRNESVPSVANQPTVNTINAQLASLDATTIENYLNQNKVPATAISLSAEDLNKLNSLELDELLKDFTDQQLTKYIEETPDMPAATTPKNHNHPSS